MNFFTGETDLKKNLNILMTMQCDEVTYNNAYITQPPQKKIISLSALLSDFFSEHFNKVKSEKLNDQQSFK